MEHLVILPSLDPSVHQLPSVVGLACTAIVCFTGLRWLNSPTYAIACFTLPFHCVSIALMLLTLLSHQPMALAATSVIFPPMALEASIGVSGEFSKADFAKVYKPAEQQLRQIEKQLPILEAERDFLRIQSLSNGTII